MNLKRTGRYHKVRLTAHAKGNETVLVRTRAGYRRGAAQ